jgi:hypothetical protein
MAAAIVALAVACRRQACVSMNCARKLHSKGEIPGRYLWTISDSIA